VDLTIVIPVYNEAENIPSLVDEIADCLAGSLDYEVIVVDDGSIDASFASLSACREQHPELRILQHRSRCGQSAAIASGVAAAGADLVATMDGDGQNDPADISLLYRAFQDAPEEVWLVAGYRKRRRDSWLKRFSSRTANAVRGFVLQDSTPDTGCGLKIFRRETFNALPWFDHMHRFLPALMQRQGGRVISVEVNHRERRLGKSKYGVHNRLWVGIVDMLGVMWLQRRMKQPVVTEVR